MCHVTQEPLATDKFKLLHFVLFCCGRSSNPFFNHQSSAGISPDLWNTPQTDTVGDYLPSGCDEPPCYLLMFLLWMVGDGSFCWPASFNGLVSCLAKCYRIWQRYILVNGQTILWVVYIGVYNVTGFIMKCNHTNGINPTNTVVGWILRQN